MAHFSAIPASTAPPSLLSTFSIPSFLGLSGGKSTTLYTTLAIIFALLVLEQSVYRYKKASLPGAKWTIPLIGKFADSLKPSMEGYRAQWDSGDLSAVSVFNIFIVMASSNDLTHKILNTPSHAEPCLVHAAKQIVLPENWVFMTGKPHVDYRKGLNMLFTRKALGMYVGIQDLLAREHYKMWYEEGQKQANPAISVMMRGRHMNMDTSLTVFTGSYIPEHARLQISEKYWDITCAFELVNFPLAIPGTKLYRAIKARKQAMHWLECAASQSKLAMAAGAVPECMLDCWITNMAEPGYNGRTEFSDHEMAMVIFSFLFASQDAMSSGLTYGLQHLSDHPEIVAKIRAEQDAIRQGDNKATVTLEMYDQMTYLQAVVKETLRVKPPVTMVPYLCTKAWPITDTYTVPVNSMIIPSFFNSLHDPAIFPEPEVFNPDRWLDPESSANVNPKNYMVWGAGPHKCIAIEYATMNIALCLATMCVYYDFEHDITPESYKVQIITALFPLDGCRLKLTARK